MMNNFEINPIGIGTWELFDKKRIDSIKYSIERGQNHIDTAEMYGDGKAEEVVGAAIKGFNRDKLFIASKIWKTSANKGAIVPAVENMLKRLDIDYLDLIYMHTPNVEVPMEEYMGGLNEVVDKGLAKGLGISNFDLEQTKKANSLTKNTILANQILYNVLEKGFATEEFKEYHKKNNIMIVAYSPLGMGKISDFNDNKIIRELAVKYGKSEVQIAINWLISQENVVTIPKAAKKEHIDENLGALEFEMDRKDYAKIAGLAGP